MLIAHGYSIYAHPAFLASLQALLDQCLSDRAKHPSTWLERAAFKRLRVVFYLITDAIPADPTNARYRQGKTLGAHTGWFRAKFGNGRFRLFYRVSVRDRMLILGWLNDDRTLRTYGAKDDAYAAFARRLQDGDPPGDWTALLAEATIMDEIIAQCRELLALLSLGGTNSQEPETTA